MHRRYTLFLLFFPLAALAINGGALEVFEKDCERAYGVSFLDVPQGWSAKSPERSLEDLQKWVDDAKGTIRSPRDLLVSFNTAAKQGTPKDGWPTENFLLGGSRSTQKDAVDKENPRGLVYGNGLVLAMTDHPGAATSPKLAAVNQRVEVAQFDSTKNRFRFGVLDFAKDPPKVVESNDCTECHGQPPTLIWQTTPFWDLLTRVSPTNTVDRKGSIYEVMKNKDVDRWRDAVAFTGYVDRLNLRRIARTLRDSTAFASYRYATLAAILGCGDIPSFLGAAAPAHAKAWPQGLDGLTQDTLTALEAQHASDFAYAKKRLPHLMQGESPLKSTTTFYDVGRIASLRYLFEKRGVSFRDLSTNRAPGGLGSFAIAGSGTVSELGTIELLCHLLPDMVRPGVPGSDDRLLRLVEARAGNARAGDATDSECALLRELSTQALGPGGPREKSKRGHVEPAR